MSQTAITTAFEQWKARQSISNEAIALDEFVFARVPGLDVSAPVDRAETLPPAAQIVHRQAVSRTGVVNENAVVFSVVLGADTGDFAFNWIGLVNRASNTLAMVVHAPEQQKLKTAAGQQGNVLTRSFLMEFNGAQKETGIHTPAETWQIDFTARMAGMDERQRLENMDIYGAAAFFGDGWLVGKNGAQYFVTQGAGYVGGLRAQLAANMNIAVTAMPVKVWLDVCWKGTLTSVWQVESTVTVATELADYVKDGVQHYVFALASIDASGTVTDLRPKGTLDGQQAGSDFLRIAENLNDVPDRAAARNALGLKGAALLDVGQGAETVAAGDDPRIAGAVQRGGDVMTGRLDITTADALRIKVGGRGAILRFDGSDAYLLFTDAGNADGGYNTLRPIRINAATGAVSLAGNSGCEGNFLVGGAQVSTDGNIHGGVWGGWLSNWAMPRFQNEGTVGTFVLAYYNGGDINLNTLVAGGNLFPSTADGAHLGSSLPGTWRCCGLSRTTNEAHRTSLWQRVA